MIVCMACVRGNVSSWSIRRLSFEGFVVKPVLPQKRERLPQNALRDALNGAKLVLMRKSAISRLDQAWIATLERIRKALNEQHGVPFEETRRTP